MKQIEDKIVGIQFLRGFAALLVILYHSGNALTGIADRSYVLDIPFVYDRGYYAVDLFFAISGFIICQVFDRGRFSLGSFLFRRFWRIYPVYWIFCVIAVFWFRLGLPQLGDDPGWDNVIASLAILPQPSFPIFAVGWTLEHEVIFYLLAGLLLPVIRAWGLLTVLLVLAIISWTGMFGDTWTYHFISPTHLQFAAGIFAYLTFKRVVGTPWFVFAALGIVFYLMPEMKFMDLNNHRLFVAIGSCMMIYAALSFDFSRHPVLQWGSLLAGNLTYSAYLTHWVVLPIFGLVASAFIAPQMAEPYRLLAVVAAILVSYGFNVFIEKPLLKVGGWLERSVSGRLYTAR